MKRKTLILCCIGVVILVFLIDGFIRFYCHPIKKEIAFSSRACLFYGTEEDACEIVEISIGGEELSYLFKNEPDAVQGEIWINGYGIFGHGDVQEFDWYLGGMYNEFPADEEYSYHGSFMKENECISYVVSRGMASGIIRFEPNSELFDHIEIEPSGTATLVYPADSDHEGRALLDKLLPFILDK